MKLNKIHSQPIHKISIVLNLSILQIAVNDFRRFVGLMIRFVINQSLIKPTKMARKMLTNRGTELK